QVIRYGRQAPTRRGTVGPLGSSPAVRPAVPRRAVVPRPANPPDPTTAPSTLTAHTCGQLPAAPGRGRRVQTPDARPLWSALRAPLPAPGIRDLRDLPPLVGPHQLDRVHAAVPDLAVEVERVRRPHRGHVAVHLDRHV